MTQFSVASGIYSLKIEMQIDSIGREIAKTDLALSISLEHSFHRDTKISLFSLPTNISSVTTTPRTRLSRVSSSVFRSQQQPLQDQVEDYQSGGSSSESIETALEPQELSKKYHSSDRLSNLAANSTGNPNGPRKSKSQQFFTSLKEHESIKYQTAANNSRTLKLLPQRSTEPKSLLSKKSGSSTTSSWFLDYERYEDSRSDISEQSRFLSFNLGCSLVTYAGTRLFSRLHLKMICTCHQVNEFGSSSVNDISPFSSWILMGFVTGDLILYDPVRAEYLRFNQDGYLNRNSVVSVCWINANQFVAGFLDCSVILFDKDVPETPRFLTRSRNDSNSGSDTENDENNEVSNASFNGETLNFKVMGNRTRGKRRNPLEIWSFCPPPRPRKYTLHTSISDISNDADGKQSGFTKSPVICDIAASIDGIVACCLSRGVVYLIQTWSTQQQSVMINSQYSYYAGFKCCKWSSDGKILACGGQDDAITLFDRYGGALARLEGHDSWVTSLDISMMASLNVYSIISGGEDRKICFWEVETNFKPVKRVENEDYAHEVKIISPTQSIILHRFPITHVQYIQNNERKTRKDNDDDYDGEDDGKTGDFLSVSRDGNIRVWTRSDTSSLSLG